MCYNNHIKILLIALLLHMVSVIASDELLEIICPDLEGSNSSITNTPTPYISQLYSQESNTKYCRCQLHVTRSGKTVIIKCDFNFEQKFKLTEKIFPFKRHQATSAYVRMSNCNGGVVTSKFLDKWMEAPSSAVDIWNCQNISIGSALDPPKFEKIQTFIGTGIINCTIDEFPTYFLRDRTRGALRFKGCNIGTMKPGIFHNIAEMRYLVIEDSVIGSVEGPLSTTGVIQLSKKSMHSWDGLEIINSTIHSVAPFAFSIAHKNDTEDMIIKNSNFGYLGTGAFNATGDIKVQILENTIEKMDSMAFKVSVSAPLYFSGNNIQTYKNDSLEGLNCSNRFSMINNTLFVDSHPEKQHKSPFKTSCGAPKVSYLVKPKTSSNHAALSVTILIIALIATLTCIIVYVVRSKSFILYKLKRHDDRLCDEDSPYGDRGVIEI